MAVVPSHLFNPFRPGAGQRPVYLAGRSREKDLFAKLLAQRPVMRNAIVTGLRGVGKTVLVDELKAGAQGAGWLWTGNDLSEAATLTEDNIARRLVTDLSALLGPMLIRQSEELPFGFSDRVKKKEVPLSFDDLWKLYETTPGLTTDKLKAVIRSAQSMLKATNVKGIVFAYDEAQILADHAARTQYPLSTILDVFASLQRGEQSVQVLLVLAGLPTLFPKLNEARTFTERMFDVLTLDRLSLEDSRLAIVKPIELTKSPVTFPENTVERIASMSGGYPYFIQYICKEVFDAWIGQIKSGEAASVASDAIIAKLDQDFFAPRWERATDRQQEFMRVIACLETGNEEFSAPEIVTHSKVILKKGFSQSHTVQMLKALSDRGLIYRNRHGKYCLAVPMMADFINRQAVAALRSSSTS